MKKLISGSIILLFVCIGAYGQREIQMFPNPKVEGRATEERIFIDEVPVAGKTILKYTDIQQSSFTIYPAPGVGRPCVIICPGGGYGILSWDLEGTEIQEWLNGIGITAVILKYRVPALPGKKSYEAPLEDIQRAISWLRYNADDMGIDPAKIGVLGFSAGAHLSAMASNSWQNRVYPSADAIDAVSCRPDFSVLVYPASLGSIRDNTLALSPDVNITAETPPTIIIQTEDDERLLSGTLVYYYNLKEAKVPVTMHLYEYGGHGYGLRKTGAPVNEWPERVETWFKEWSIVP